MRLIDADALLKHEVEADRMSAMLVVGKGFILDAPTIEPKRGKWVNDPQSPPSHKCSCCGSNAYCSNETEDHFEDLTAYCPDCGVDMRQEPQKG